MKRSLYLIGLIILVIYIAALLIIPRISPRPEELGVSHGQLKPCPGTPNCVSSQSTSADLYEHRKPIALSQTMTAQTAIDSIAAIVESMPRSTIVEKTDTYLYAEFRTFALRFIDDVEFYADKSTGYIHYRSASRLGRRDFGVNGKRMDKIVQQYLQQ